MQTDSKPSPCVWHPSTPRLVDLLSLSSFWPWLRGLCHILAPAALSVDPMKGFVLTLIPVVNLTRSCSSRCCKLSVNGVLCHESQYKQESSPFRPCFTSVTLELNSRCRRSHVSPAKRNLQFCHDIALLLLAVGSKGSIPAQSSLWKSWHLIWILCRQSRSWERI